MALGEKRKLLMERLSARTTRTKIAVQAITFKVPMASVSPYKPPYLSGIVTYEDDQTAIFHSNFTQIHFSESGVLYSVIFTSNFHDDFMITSPQQASS
jgi:hypothetical protein